MKILYGVQATGHGHISRARAMATAFAKHDAEVTWLFSGRERNHLPDMTPFGDFEHREGLTFRTAHGRVQHVDTVLKAKPLRFLRDVMQLDLSGYDVVVTDFEPVTAWAAKRAGVPSVGIGHQYAFGPGVPSTGSNIVTRAIMRQFAPAQCSLGLHWFPYRDNVLPPILDLPDLQRGNAGHILVYLPFEDQDTVIQLLNTLPDTQFVLYSGGVTRARRGNVDCYPTDNMGFKQHLASCRGVLCNSGFELVSECLQWGKPLLTRPLAGQTEQLSNALAIEQLGYGHVMHSLSVEQIQYWLGTMVQPPAAPFTNVAQCLAAWLAGGMRESISTLQYMLWPVAMTHKAPVSGLTLNRAA
ncbi:MAG: glycosyltransferase family protein [Halioglobus sp.]